jgi:antitoxin Phd
MKQWAIYDVKNQLSRVINLAQSKGPQTITRHGKPGAVLVAVNESKTLPSLEESPLTFFFRFKGIGLARRKDLPLKTRR